MIIFYVPCKDDAEAKELAKKLIDDKLIACANILPSKSIYRWKGKIEEDSESILFVKTLESKADMVQDEIRRLHSYDTPAIIRMDADVNEEYLDWMEEQI